MPVFNKVWSLLIYKEKSMVMYILLFIIMTAILETLGIGLIIPVIKIIFSENLENYISKLSSIAFLGSFADTLQYFDRFKLILYCLITLCSVYFLKAILIIFFNWKKEKYLNLINLRLTQGLFKKYLTQEYLFHKNSNSPELVRNIQAVTAVPNTLKFLINIVSDLFISFFIIAFLLFIEPRGILLILFSTSILCLIYYLGFRKKLRALGARTLELSSKFNKTVFQGLHGIKAVKLYKVENQFANELGVFFSSFLENSRINRIITDSSRYFLESFAIVIMSVLLFLILKKDDSYQDIISILAVFALAGFKIIPSSNKILTNLNSLKYSSPTIDLVFKDFSLKNKNLQNYKYDKSINFNSEIDLKNIYFTYPEKKNEVFKNINLRIKKGEMIGILGESGSGKSTLLDLMSGLLEPDRGEVLVDGINLKNIKPEFLNQISYISQSTYLFDESIKKNVAFNFNGDEINVEKVIDSLNKAQLKTFINDLPKGIESVVGERGSKLSGGQVQRMGIARALYKDSNILILDEATNALDYENQENFFKIIYQLKSIKTIIISTHRKENLKNCDRIFYVEQNKIS